MVAFSDAQLERMQSTASSTMFDSCRVLTYTAGTDTYGQEVPGNYSEGAEIDCGLTWGGGSRYKVGIDGFPVFVQDQLRLPSGTVITTDDQILVTKKMGIELDPPLLYAIIGPIEVGPTATRAALIKVTK